LNPPPSSRFLAAEAVVDALRVGDAGARRRMRRNTIQELLKVWRDAGQGAMESQIDALWLQSYVLRTALEAI